MTVIIEKSLSKTRSILPRQYHHHPGALSILLKNYLLDKFVEQHGSIDAQPRQPGLFFDRETSEVMGSLALNITKDDIEKLIDISSIEIKSSDLDVLYKKRVAQLALEELKSTPICPEVLIFPESISPEEFNAIRLHGVAFEYFPFLTNEFYALVVDCYSAHLQGSGKEECFLVAFHQSWLDEQGVHRCLWWTGPDDDLLMESDLTEPVQLDSVQTIFASPEVHSIISAQCRRFGISEINSYEASSVADDKFACYKRWKKSSVPTPEALLIPAKTSREDIKKRVVPWSEGKRRIVVQPNFGTEGKGVQAFHEADGAVDYIHTLIGLQDAIVREACGNVFYRPEGSNSVFACDLRLNVCFDGNDYYAESGYMQVASYPDEFASSASIGGKVVEFHRGCLERLVVKDERGAVVRLLLDDSARETLINTAISAAECLKGLYLVGVDLKLEAFKKPGGGWAVQGLVLDANPRPAGLMHSDRFPVKNSIQEPCISPRLWLAFDKLF